MHVIYINIVIIGRGQRKGQELSVDNMIRFDRAQRMQVPTKPHDFATRIREVPLYMMVVAGTTFAIIS